MNNLELMKTRLMHEGGIRQEDRMIKSKRRTLDRAVLYSYQACDIAKIPYELTVLENREKISGLTENELQKKEELVTVSQHLMRALINPDKLKQDYDDKILSIPYECGISNGDIIRWAGTDSYWIVYLSELTEDSYFRSSLRRCRYQISWKDETGAIQTTWAAIRGPVETKINTISKGGLVLDTPNLTLNILLPRNEHTLKMFQRYSRFLFAGLCWQVQAPDSISMDGVIEINAMENYINNFKDDTTNELVDGLVITKVDTEEDNSSGIFIKGNSMIEPIFEYSYDAIGIDGGVWSIENNCKFVEIVSQNNNNIIVKWTKIKSGKFNLVYSADDIILKKEITVNSLF